ncbi:MAG: hypothetical protein WA970_12570, partial [Gammaproteobacteria bacterium]
RQVGFAGGGTTGLRATDVHAKTLPRNTTGHNRGPEILWLYFSRTECHVSIISIICVLLVVEISQKRGGKREDRLTAVPVAF